MNKKEEAVAYLKSIIVPLVSKPEELVVDSHLDEKKGIVIQVKANDKDLPLLIGAHGAVAGSIRCLMKIWMNKNSAHCLLFIGDPIRH